MIKTKVPVTVREFGDRYTLIGPLSYKSAPMEVEACEPANEKIKACLDTMSSHGVRYLYGRWLVEGSPYVLLFDTNSVSHKLDEWKGDLWRAAGIPSPPADTETNDAILFGYLVTWFFGELTPKVKCCKQWENGGKVTLSCVVQTIWRPRNYLSFPRMVGRCSCSFDQETSS